MFSTKKLTFSAIVGAMYAALTLALAPVSFGVLQFRLSEALCVLPFLAACSAWGLFVGCLIANLISGNILDVIFGSLATLAAGLATAHFGRKHRTKPCSSSLCQAKRYELLGCLMPVLFNSIVVGIILTYAYEGQNGIPSFKLLGVNMLWLGACEAVVMLLSGLPLLSFARKSEKFSKLFSELED